MKVYKLHSECKITRGFSRSLIIDIGRNNLYYLPNLLLDILEKSNEISHKSLLLEIKKQNLEEYFDFLLKEEIFYLIDNDLSLNFSETNDDFDFPAIISNCIIEYSTFNLNNLEIILQSVTKLGCQDFLIRHDESIPLLEISAILNLFNKFTINSIQLILKKPKHNFKKSVNLFLSSNLPIRSIIFHSGKCNKYISVKDSLPTVLEITDRYSLKNSCGHVSKHYFVNGIEFYTESLNYNSCLNRKISIDVKGNIKNCPSLNLSYGNIIDNNISELVQSNAFKKYWFITKSQISVCKDCEFRNVCVDCRAFLENPNDINSKPLKCGYDPYTTKWEDWSNNPIKAKAKSFYGL